ncbi:MAG: histone deacetylase family protein [Hyphomicrobiaceae bacterium]
MMLTPVFYYPDTPDLPLPDGHRFPAGKYRMLRERVVAEGILGDASLVRSPLASRAELIAAHDPDYVDAVFDGSLEAKIQRRIGLPWSETLVRRSRLAVGGTIAAARSALRDSVSGQLAGGTHHGHRDFGAGFCTFNDLAVAAVNLLNEGTVRRISVIDLDVHQGDGNAAILAPDPRVFVISVHGEKNYPFRKIPSDLDIALPDGTTDPAYLAAVDQAIAAALQFEPDLLFYLSGADALASDSLGRLAVSFTGLRERDIAVFTKAKSYAVPTCLVLGGGYAKPIGDTVEVYAMTLRCLRQVYAF